MSKQRKKICLVAAVVIMVLVGAVIYTETFQKGDKTPGGVFVCL